MTNKLVQMLHKPTVSPGPVLVRFGDVDSITHGGGVVFQTAVGPFFEATEGVENSDDSNNIEVFRTHIEKNVLRQFNVETEEVIDLCDSMDLDPKEWVKRAKSPNLVDRASCIADIGTFCGWDIIDDDPLILSEIELHQRWYAEFNEEGPVTTSGCFRPEIIVPEMLQAVHTIHPETYWSLLRGRFPIVPSEARQNRSHPWWKQHGSGAVNKLVETMKRLAPSGFVFEVRDEQFGFWRKDTDGN